MKRAGREGRLRGQEEREDEEGIRKGQKGRAKWDMKGRKEGEGKMRGKRIGQQVKQGERGGKRRRLREEENGGGQGGRRKEEDERRGKWEERGGTY